MRFLRKNRLAVLNSGTVATEVDRQRGYASLSEFDGDPEHVLLRRTIGRDEDRAAARRVRSKEIGRDVMTVRGRQRCDALKVHTTLSIISRMEDCTGLRQYQGPKSNRSEE